MRLFRRYSILLTILFLTSSLAFSQTEADSIAELERKAAAQSQMDLYNSISYNVQLFSTLYREVSMNYVDTINPENFILAGIDGMLNTLDPYTEYYEEDETEELQIMTRGNYGGIGIQIGLRGPERQLTVIAPIEGTPGWRLGLRPGDRITWIDSVSTEGFTTSDAAKLMRGAPGDTVRITVERFGLDEPLEFAIKRELIKVDLISYDDMIEPGIGFIRLTRFDRSAGKQVKESIEKLKEKGLEALILDLRGNPGGLLPEAVSVAENFLPKDELVVSTRGRVPSSSREFKCRIDPALDANIPLVVLVNQGSASASEIVAGAIQDHDKGVIIGKPTFGKGLVQSVVDVNTSRKKSKQKAALKITTAKYYTPSGRLIQKADYFNHNDALLNSTIESIETDTLFFTDNGRQVTAHGGITPDYDIELEEIGNATLELWRQGKFFHFIGPYYAEHPEIQSYEITDKIYSEFLSYLEETEFTFQTEIQKSLEKLRTNAEELEYSEEFIKELDDLEKMSEIERSKMMDVEETQIRQRLKMELAAAMGGGTKRMESSFSFDPQVQKALEIIKDSDNYYSILMPSKN